MFTDWGTTYAHGNSIAAVWYCVVIRFAEHYSVVGVGIATFLHHPGVGGYLYCISFKKLED